MVSISHPETPGNAFSAQKAVHYLKGQLLDFGIYSFEWPQDLDSGIDIVAFATLRQANSDECGLATAFIAGFQSKGTKKAIGENSKRSVKTGNHTDYWMNASLPVFLVAVDATSGNTLVEDVGSIRSISGIAKRHSIELKSIPTEIPLARAATDIRLRMFAHALAPWVSAKLRERPLAHTDPERGLNIESPWSLLDYIAGQNSSFPIPGSWDEIRQYYELLAYMLQDADFCIQLAEDLRSALSDETYDFPENLSEDSHVQDSEAGISESDELEQSDLERKQVGALRLLVGIVELFTRFPGKEPPKKTFHPTQRIVDRLSAKTASQEVDDRPASGKETNQLSARDRSYDELLKIFMRDTDLQNPHLGVLREDLDISIEIIQAFWEKSAEGQNLTVSQLARKTIERASNLGASTTSTAILATVAGGASTLQAELRRSVLDWASKTIFVSHWTDVVGTTNSNPKPNSGLLGPETSFRSYSDHLEEQRNKE